MKSIVFIDTEINPYSGKILDFGAVDFNDLRIHRDNPGFCVKSLRSLQDDI